MKWNFKRSIASLLAITMTMSFSMTIYASSTEANQAAGADMVGNNDESDVMKVILPTDEIGMFDFILDPQGLIQKTNGAAYEGNTFEKDATLFFKRTDGDSQENYSSTSDAIKVTNKGETSIDAIVTASILDPSADGFAMTDDREFTDDTRASLYLALTDGETTIPIMVGEEASLSASIPAEGIYSFRLTGAANEKGDWLKLKELDLKVTVTWEIVSSEADTVFENEIPIQEEGISENKETAPLPASQEETDLKKAVPQNADGAGLEIIRSVVSTSNVEPPAEFDEKANSN